MNSEEQTAPPIAPPLPPGRRRRFFPRVRVIVIVLLALLLAVLAQPLIGSLESAVANIVTLICGFVALMTLLVWFVFLSAFPSLLRFLLPVALLFAVAGGFYFFDIDYVSGSLFPTLKRRGAPSKDQLLETPRLVALRDVDLSATTPRDFPQFLGPKRDLHAPPTVFETDWGKHPPRELWRKSIGAGLSAFSAVNGYAVTQEQRGEDELVTCYEIETGELKWLYAVKARHATILGRVGPRATPTIHAGKVYALGATGHLACLDGANGELIWSRNLLKEFGVESPAADEKAIAWGRSGSPLVVDGKVIVPAGGPAAGPFVSLVAYDANSGNERWRGGKSQISYSSPTLAEAWGEPSQVLIVNESSAAGHDLASGAQRWEIPWPGSSNSSASTSQVVALPGQRVLLSKGYAAGAALWQLTPNSTGEWSATPVWEKSSLLKTKFTNVAIRDGYVYGLSEGVLECVELATAKRQWRKGRFGHGQILLVGDTLLVLGEQGNLAAVQASPDAFQQLGEIQALEGQTWNNLCLFGNRLLLRNSEEAVCYELPARQ